jgi:4-amino-4-deoxy-L-arabinose transferase-like glycosyltransferase
VTAAAPLTRRERRIRRGPGSATSTVGAALRLHWAISLVIGAYVGAALVLPTRANLVMYDDFTYIRQAQEFANHLVVHVPNQAAANAVFEIVWGGTFGALLGTHLWVFRLSTLVLSLISGLAMYGLCRELGIGRNGSACGAALLLFNPLFFVLSYSFMTDPHLVALLVIATYAYLRGLRAPHRAGWTWTAGAVASLAYLSRPQGALLPIAVVVWMFLARRLRLDRAGLLELARVAAIPAAVVVGHQAWLRAFNGVPKDQAGFTQQFVDLGLHDLSLLVGRLTYVELMYLGLFLVPVAVGVVLSLRGIVRRMSRGAWISFGVFVAVVTVGFWFFQTSDRRMPYVGSWLTTSGLGPDGIYRARDAIMQPWMIDLLTWGSFLAAVVVGLLVCRALFDRAQPHRREAALLVIVLLAMAAGAVAPSVVFDYAISLDRYLLPLVPFGIALAIWACRGIRVWRFGLAVGLVTMAGFSVVATHDNLEFHSAVWELDRYARSIGVPDSKLDGGAGWTRYYVADRGKPVTPFPGAVQSWWITADHRTSAQYMVSGAPLPGYEMLRVLDYPQWLQTKPAIVYLMKIPDANAKLAQRQSSGAGGR